MIPTLSASLSLSLNILCLELYAPLKHKLWFPAQFPDLHMVHFFLSLMLYSFVSSAWNISSPMPSPFNGSFPFNFHLTCHLFQGTFLNSAWGVKSLLGLV